MNCVSGTLRASKCQLRTCQTRSRDGSASVADTLFHHFRMWRIILKRYSVFVQKRCKTSSAKCGGRQWFRLQASPQVEEEPTRARRGPHEPVFQTGFNASRIAFRCELKSNQSQLCCDELSILAVSAALGTTDESSFASVENCRQGDLRALQLFKLRHLLDTLGRKLTLPQRCLLANDLYMACRNSLDLMSKPSTLAGLFEA